MLESMKKLCLTSNMRTLLITLFLFVSFNAHATVTKREVEFAYHEAGTIVIRTSERKLYYSLGNGKAYEYGIAVGSEGNEWYGKSVVTKKAENPSWYPTKDQKSKNPRLPQSMGAGPQNPLGARAIYLGWSALRVHGTIVPTSIGRAASGGCYRMHNDDVIDLYSLVHVGAPVIVE
jgi:lipoprotein-anchoring transpeptidase ErfK/SrfK